jgi:hypothetical protein
MLDATTAEMIKLCVMAQRTKKLARNHKSAFPKKPIRSRHERPFFLVECRLLALANPPIRLQGWPLPPAPSARKQNVGAQSQDRVLIFF